MKQQITQIVIALTIILWFAPLPRADACGNAVAFAHRSKQDLATAKTHLQLGENEDAIDLAERARSRGTPRMKDEANSIIRIAKVRLVLKDPTFYDLHVRILKGKTPLEKMRHAEFLLAKKHPKKALKLLRYLKRKGEMPNHFGWFALSNAEKTLGHLKRAKYALQKGKSSKKKWNKERRKKRNQEDADTRWKKDIKVVGRVIPGQVLVKGGLDDLIIQRVVRQHRRELRYCYELGLQKNRNLKGIVKVKFVIPEDGNVVNARVLSSTLKDKNVQSCMTGKIRRWVFPEALDGKSTTIEYPFKLRR